jgi:hypothetical protein
MDQRLYGLVSVERDCHVTWKELFPTCQHVLTMEFAWTAVEEPNSDGRWIQLMFVGGFSTVRLLISLIFNHTRTLYVYITVRPENWLQTDISEPV